MDREVSDILKGAKIQKELSNAIRNGTKIHTPSGSFSELLGRVSREVQTLKNKAAGATGNLVPEKIQRPEELEAAFREAGRNYHSVMKVGKNLIKAYKVTLEAVENQKANQSAVNQETDPPSDRI